MDKILFFLIYFALITLPIFSQKDINKDIGQISNSRKRIAFLVGVNKYSATTTLKFAVRDSDSIEEILLKTGKYDKLIKLNDNGKTETVLNPITNSYLSKLNKNFTPTKKNIESIYAEILKENPETLLFYFSGHGFILGESNDNEIAPNDVSIKTDEKKVNGILQTTNSPENGISLSNLANKSNSIKNVVFLIDACRSPIPRINLLKTKNSKSTSFNISNSEKKNEFSEELILPIRNFQSLENIEIPERITNSEGVVMLIGAAPGISSIEDEVIKSGIFTHFLKKGLEGEVQEENQEEFITDENLSKFIDKKFKNYFEMSKIDSPTKKIIEPKLYKLTFNRGKKGEILITYHRPILGKERVDKPKFIEPNRNREINGQLYSNKDGIRDDLRFFVKDIHRDIYFPDSYNEIYKLEYLFENNSLGKLETFSADQFNIQNKIVFTMGIRPSTEYNGWEINKLYKPSEKEEKIANRKNIHFKREIIDYNGNILIEEFFDNLGTKLELEGVSKTVRTWTPKGKLISEEYYNNENKPTEKDGVFKYFITYNTSEYIQKEEWFDKNNNLTVNGNNYSKIEYKYDQDNYLLSVNHLEKEGNKIDNSFGYSQIIYNYNSDCLKERKNDFFSTGQEKYYTEWAEKNYKYCITKEEYLDSFNRPASNEKRVHKIVRLFNKKGFLISEEKFKQNLKRYSENGVSQTLYEYDIDDNIISKKQFGEFTPDSKLVPVSDLSGVHEYRYSYFYTLPIGKKILNECLYIRKINNLPKKPFECALTVEHFGHDGISVADHNDIFRTYIYYSGVNQTEEDRHYYSLEDKFLFAEKYSNKIKNSFGKDSMVSFFKKKGKKYLIDSKFLYIYDESGNIVLELNFGFKSNKEYLITKNYYEYENDKNTFIGSFKIENENEILFNKSILEYDKQGNLTKNSFYKVENENDSLLSVSNYIYKKDSKNLTSEKYIQRNGKLEIESKSETIFDLNENLIGSKKILYENGKEEISFQSEFEYDEFGNKTLLAFYTNENGKLILTNKEEYKFDKKKNKLLEAKYIRSNNKLLLERKIETIYNADGNPTEIKIYDTKDDKEALHIVNNLKYNQKGQLISKNKLAGYNLRHDYTRIFEYDKNGNLILESDDPNYLSSNKAFSKIVYAYNSQNKRTLYAFYKGNFLNPNLIEKIIYKYDSNGNLIEHTVYKDDSEVLTYKKLFEFDEKGNKTLELSFAITNGQPEVSQKIMYKYDDSGNKILEANYKIENKKETLKYKNIFSHWPEKYNRIVNEYNPKIKIIKDEIKELEKSNLIDKKIKIKEKILSLEEITLEFEELKKKYTLSIEKFGQNEIQIISSHNLIIQNPKNTSGKDFIRIQLDEFYRPISFKLESD